VKILLISTTLVSIFFSSFVQADTSPKRWNVDIFAGKQDSDRLNWAGADFNTNSGNAAGIRASKQITPRFAVGLELSNTKNEYTGFEPNRISARSTLLTAEYDFYQRGRFSTYGGLGLGAVRVKYVNNGSSYTNSDTVTGGRLSLGARYALTPRTKMFIEARHANTSSDPMIAGLGATNTAEYKGDSLVLGLRISF